MLDIKLNKKAKSVIYSLIWYVIIFLIVGFCKGQFDPLDWSVDERGWTLFSGTMVNIFTMVFIWSD